MKIIALLSILVAISQAAIRYDSFKSPYLQWANNFYGIYRAHIFGFARIDINNPAKCITTSLPLMSKAAAAYEKAVLANFAIEEYMAYIELSQIVRANCQVFATPLMSTLTYVVGNNIWKSYFDQPWYFMLPLFGVGIYQAG